MWKYANQPFAAEAESRAADNPSEVVSRLTERIGELKASLATLRPEYECSAPRVAGGVPASKAYQIQVPFLGPCEVAIVAVANSDANTSSANVLVSTNPNLDPGVLPSTTSQQTLDGGMDWLFIATVTGGTSVVPALTWYPLRGDSALYVYVASGGSTKASYVTLQFRRRINPVGVPSVGY